MEVFFQLIPSARKANSPQNINLKSLPQFTKEDLQNLYSNFKNQDSNELKSLKKAISEMIYLQNNLDQFQILALGESLSVYQITAFYFIMMFKYCNE